MWARLATRFTSKLSSYTSSKERGENSIVLYTVITNNYDELKEIPKQFINPHIDYICLTDNKKLRSNTYKIQLIEEKFDEPLQNRFYKLTINKYIKDYKISIYIDGKISIVGDFYHLLEELSNYDFISFKHYKRDCLYKEGAVLLHPYKQQAAKENVVPLIQKIKQNKFPKKFGLCDTSILIRKHNEKIINSMDLWFYMLRRYSKRDQLSFMYCIWKNQVNLLCLEHKLKAPYFRKHDHIHVRNLDKYWLESDNPWLECFDPYENRKYYFNKENRLCKWDLEDEYSEEHYRFLENGYRSVN